VGKNGRSYPQCQKLKKDKRKNCKRRWIRAVHLMKIMEVEKMMKKKKTNMRNMIMIVMMTKIYQQRKLISSNMEKVEPK